MRVILTAVVGAVASIAALAVSRSGTGAPEAALFLLAISTATLTVGLVAAMIVGGIGERPGYGPAGGPLPHRATAPGECGSCRSRMVRVATFWICGRCDRVPVQS